MLPIAIHGHQHVIATPLCPFEGGKQSRTVTPIWIVTADMHLRKLVENPRSCIRRPVVHNQHIRYARKYPAEHVCDMLLLVENWQGGQEFMRHVGMVGGAGQESIPQMDFRVYRRLLLRCPLQHSELPRTSTPFTPIESSHRQLRCRSLSRHSGHPQSSKSEKFTPVPPGKCRNFRQLPDCSVRTYRMLS